MCRLPSREDMWKDIEAKRTMRTRRFLPSQRYSLEIDYLTYMDEIAELLDCKPDLCKSGFSVGVTLGVCSGCLVLTPGHFQDMTICNFVACPKCVGP